MKKELTYLAAASLGLMSITSTAFADEEVKAAPSLSSVLEASGITATGYVAASFYDQTADTASHQFDTLHDSYQLDQAAFTLAYQPKEGFGALVNVVGGQDAKVINAATSNGTNDSPVALAQAYVQYVGGPVTVIAGKFATLAGAEVFAPTGNTNYSRSLLFFNEPLLHSGVRATVAVNDVFGFSLGVNNGWNYDNSWTSKTAEVGISLTPSKKFALTAQGYSGEDPNGLGGTGAGKRTFFDLVATINATDSLSFVVSYDNGKQESDANAVPDLKWDGIAGYVNFAFNDQWRISGRYETIKLTQSGSPDLKQQEATVTLGFAPVKSFELRAEIRQDTVDKINGVGGFDIVFDGPGALTDPTDNGTEFALQGVYKF